MPDDTEMQLLQQRVEKHRKKLEQASTLAQLTQRRLDEVSAHHDQAQRERERTESALEVAESRARRLAKEAKRARRLARSAR